MIQVLIVEDDPMVAQINQEYIERIPGFRVVKTAQNGQSALDYLEDNINQINLIILDVFMPKMNGIELLERIRQEYSRIDVIFVTAAKEKAMIQRGLELGAIDYLIKPFTFERIRKALLKYNQRYLLFSKEDDMSQEDVDQLINSKDSFVLPKGIHPITLKAIEKLVEESKSILELNQMTDKLSVSLVTLRLYLDYLVDNDKLIKEVNYGSVGRPNYSYRKGKGR